MNSALPQLNSRFRQLDEFRSSVDSSYKVLPFRFMPFDSTRYIATNMVGEYLLLQREDIESIINGTLIRSDKNYDLLRSKHFIVEDSGEVVLDLLATKWRTKLSYLSNFTGLHIFVVTLRCDHSCPYCQVSRVSQDRSAYDMSLETARSSIDLMFCSPSRYLKVEFQGGESLLNFELIKQIVIEVKQRNAVEQRNIEFVIATNLSPLTDEMLTFAKEHQVDISTSLDGPRELHNANRPHPEKNSYERAIKGIARVREAIGPHRVSALMTTTRKSLEQPEAIIDEYIAQGFHSIFLRWLNPFGFAVKSEKAVGYDAVSFNNFYKRGLEYILQINKNGYIFREDFASILLRKIMTTYDTGFVDLRSPAGLALSVIVYNFDGKVYASDESRMLGEVGDDAFCLGTVDNSFHEIFGSEKLLSILQSTMTESTPCCCDCAFEPFCGTNPTFHYATQGDMIGHRPTSAFCNRIMYIIRLLIDILENDSASSKILTSWAFPVEHFEE